MSLGDELPLLAAPAAALIGSRRILVRSQPLQCNPVHNTNNN